MAETPASAVFPATWEYSPAPESVKVEIPESTRLFIGGKFVDPHSKRRFTSVNPATEEPLSKIAEGDAQDVDAAVAAARKAFKGWSRLPAAERAKYLYRIARRIQERARELAVLETIDGGKPIKESRDVDVPLAAQHFFHHAGWCDKLRYAMPGARDPRPVGVCGQVIPWNFPLLMAAWKLAPALAAGNTVVLKPAEYTPLTALLFAEITREAGLPKGVLNIVTGDGDTGAALVAHPGVDKIAFTGSTAVGKAIRRATAGTGKALTLELGGKSPYIVFDDADIDGAVEGAFASKYRNAGQTCVCANRIYVQDGVYDEFVKKFAAKVQALKVGNGFEDGVMQGPLIEPAAVAKVQRHLEDAIQRGGQVVTGGQTLQGQFFQPTVVANASSDMLCAKEETFGPFAPVFRFKTEQEAIDAANNTEFGLASYFYSRDVGRIFRVSEGLEYGMVGINVGIIATEHVPFGGVKQSGLGREGSHHGMDEYVELKYLCIGDVLK